MEFNDRDKVMIKFLGIWLGFWGVFTISAIGFTMEHRWGQTLIAFSAFCLTRIIVSWMNGFFKKTLVGFLVFFPMMVVTGIVVVCGRVLFDQFPPVEIWVANLHHMKSFGVGFIQFFTGMREVIQTGDVEAFVRTGIKDYTLVSLILLVVGFIVMTYRMVKPTN